MISKAEQKSIYSMALLLSNSKRKTFEELGKYIGVSGDTVIRKVNKHVSTVEELMFYSKKLFKNKAVSLAIDDTLIPKPYSQKIEGTSDNYDSSEGRLYRSLCSVVAVLTDGNFTIPIGQKIWTSAEFVQQKSYKKKWEVARDLIVRILSICKIKTVVMDGLYAVREFMSWMILETISFEMRFHSNRVVEYKGKRCQLKHLPALKLSGKRPQRTIRVLWNGMFLYVTAFRRINRKNNVVVVYQVSNYKASASEHIKTYSRRWNIEKFFRTAKQKLGLKDCLSRKQKTQENHIMSVFLAYAFAQFERKRCKFKNTEEAIKSLKQQNLLQLNYHLRRSGQIFAHA